MDRAHPLYFDGVIDLDRLGIALEMGPHELHALFDNGRTADAEARAASAERRLRDRTELLGEMQHKLKTSFSVISGWSRTLDESWDRISDEERREGVQSIRRRAEDVITHAHQLLEEVKSEITSLDLDPVPIDLAAVLRLSAGTYGAVSRHHTIIYEGPSEVAACVDPAALQQVLGQLLENAVKYSPDGGTIVLGVVRETNHVAITVSDEGIGIPGDLDVFAPFQRGPVGSEIPGTGLGLYIARNLVRAMGGAISAYANEGRGSTVTVTLRQ